MTPRNGCGRTSKPWFPFSVVEAEIALAIGGIGTTILNLLGVEGAVVVGALAAYLLAAYFAGLLVQAIQVRPRLVFVPYGGLEGRGYVSQFSLAERRLLLIHADDDPPCSELTALYRHLLDDGVQIRRIIILRVDAKASSYQWIASFGAHSGLRQRVLLAKDSRLFRTSFAVIDEHRTVLAVPSASPSEGTAYDGGYFLHHILVLCDREVTASFSRVHQELWSVGAELESPSDLAAPRDLVARLDR